LDSEGGDDPAGDAGERGGESHDACIAGPGGRDRRDRQDNRDKRCQTEPADGALSSTTACRAVPADRPSLARHWAAGKRRYKLRRMLGLVTRVKAARRRTQTLFELNLEVDTLWRAPRPRSGLPQDTVRRARIG
jgi:hypothetical protein